ncbi:MAG TPA: methyltransferase domain-containing protein [Gemmatimonadaceae bacterium]|nr:methyltransferase domain-containing protein [Gemmatimonadaceae bacterium]
MDADPASIWKCPECLGSLEPMGPVIGGNLRCSNCGQSYETVDDIPDLRFPRHRSGDRDSDFEEARQIAAGADGKTMEQLVRSFFSVREGMEGWTRSDTDLRARQSIAAPDRLQREVAGWLQPVTQHGRFLDLGCGLGGLLLAASREGKEGIGIDNRMSVLVVAKRLIEMEGHTATLACASAERLPLSSEAVGGVVMYDVVEHVDHLEQALAETSRVTKTSGVFACSTPNRFSLAPEPHVRVWGVGWLPRKYQRAYVKARSGMDYSGTRLLSPAELRRILATHTKFDITMRVPGIPPEEIETSRGLRRLLARTFNSLARIPAVIPLLLRVGPFFQVIGIKRRVANTVDPRT